MTHSDVRFDFNGVMDSLQFHYPQTGIDENSLFWNPQISWQNKYAKCAFDQLCEPIRPAFWGATTFLSFLTDGWHLAKFFHLNLSRLAIIFAALWVFERRKKITWGDSVLFFALLAVIQSAGFHFVYSFIF